MGTLAGKTGPQPGYLQLVVVTAVDALTGRCCFLSSQLKDPDEETADGLVCEVISLYLQGKSHFGEGLFLARAACPV